MTRHRDLIAGLKRGPLKPLYLFAGEEAFLVQEAVDLIIASAVDPAARDFNYNALSCRETPAGDLVNLCQTLPFMAERRLVVAREFEAYKAGDLDVLVPYLGDPSPSTCLVLVTGQRKYEKKDVIAAVEASGESHVFYQILDSELPAWIANRARGMGLGIARDAVLALQQLLGNDLQKLDGELQKLALSLAGRKEITYDDVRRVAGDFREYTAFDLAEAVGARDAERALTILARLLQEGEQPVAILGSIAWNVRRLLQAKAYEAAGMGAAEIQKKLRVIFHQAVAFREQMRRNSAAELRGMIGTLLAADRQLKTSAGGNIGRLVLERLILRLCETA